MIRKAVTVLAVVALVVAVLGLLSRYLPISQESVLVVAAASPYLTVAGLLALILFAATRRWLLTIVAALLCFVMIAVQLPRFFGPEETTVPSTPVRVMTANLALGEADPSAIVKLAHDSADVLAVQEMTPPLATRLSAAGLDTAFPFRVIDPQRGATGIGIWSRFPIVASAPIRGYAMPMLTARIRVPGIRFEPTVVSLHMAAPWVQPIGYWRDDLARLPDTLRQLSRDAGSAAVIVAGDFNSTYDMLPFRRLLDVGYRDAAEQAGSGLTLSFPSGPRWPTIGIDHVLVYNCAATWAQTAPVQGSDHLALLTTVDVPADLTAS